MSGSHDCASSNWRCLATPIRAILRSSSSLIGVFFTLGLYHDGHSSCAPGSDVSPFAQVSLLLGMPSRGSALIAANVFSVFVHGAQEGIRTLTPRRALAP